MKVKFSSIWRLTLAMVLALSLALMATPVSAHPDVTITEASGGGTISADTAADAPSPAWTSLGAITLAEGAAGDIGMGTIIFNLPTGFEYDTAAPPDVAVTGTTPELTAEYTGITATQLTVTVTANSTTETDNALVIGGTNPIRVRPTQGTPPASGDIVTDAGSTSTILGVTHGTTPFGTLNEVPGAVTQLLVEPVDDNDGNEATGSPTTTQIAGTAFGVRLTLEDQFGNTATNFGDTTVDVTWSSNAGVAPDGTQPTIPDDSAIDLSDGVAEVAGFTLTKVQAGVTITAGLDADQDGTFDDPVNPTASDSVFVEGINLDSEGYHTSSTVSVTLGDQSKNAQPAAREVASIRATSSTLDPDYIVIALQETDVDTGIFAGSFQLVGETPGTGQLLVSTGDTITVTYPTDTNLEVAPLNEATVDDVAPVFTDVTGPEYIANGSEVTLDVTLDAAGYTVTADFSNIDSGYGAGDEIVVDNGGGSYTVTYTITAGNTKADGAYVIPVTATDVASNEAEWTDLSITLDNTEPSVSAPTANPSVVQPGTATDVTFTAAVADEGSGVDSVTIDLSSVGGAVAEAMLDDGTQGDGEAGDGVYGYVFSGLSVADEGEYDLTIMATDAVGNDNDTVSVILRVISDVDGPTIVSSEVSYPMGVVSARVGDPVTITAVVTDDLAGVDTVVVDATEIGLTDSEAMSLVEGTTDTYSVTLDVQVGTTTGTKTLSIVATDLATNESSANVSVEISTRLTAYNIQLSEGWNLISLPLIPDTTGIGTILASVSDNIDVVWGYDPVNNPADPWSMYKPGLIEDDLTQMVDGLGYWVRMTDSAILAISGIEMPDPPTAPPTYDVASGWNLIGVKDVGLGGIVYTDYLESVTGDYSVIWGYAAETGYYNIHPLTPPADDPLMPGQGYWLWMKTTGIIVPPR